MCRKTCLAMPTFRFVETPTPDNDRDTTELLTLQELVNCVYCILLAIKIVYYKQW